jgi:hypothetical protein
VSLAKRQRRKTPLPPSHRHPLHVTAIVAVVRRLRPRPLPRRPRSSLRGLPAEVYRRRLSSCRSQQCLRLHPSPVLSFLLLCRLLTEAGAGREVVEAVVEREVGEEAPRPGEVNTRRITPTHQRFKTVPPWNVRSQLSASPLLDDLSMSSPFAVQEASS